MEGILALCLVLVFVSLLVYFYFHEKEEKKYIKGIQASLITIPSDLQKLYAEIAERDNARTQKTLSETFTKYLKHIENLERMVLPKPVTTKDVQSVMSRIGQVADESLEIQNDIEKEEDKGVEMPSDTWTGYINAETKVAFENEESSTVLE